MKHQPEPRTVYKTERMEVIRNGFRDFSLYIDGELVSFHQEQFEAEHEGAVILEEMANDLAAGLRRAA